MAVGDLATLSLVPWQPGYARIVCNGHVRKNPWPFDTRFILQQQIARLADRGWLLNTGLEPEFMLLNKRSDGSLGPADESDRLDKPCYDYKGLSRSRARSGNTGRLATRRSASTSTRSTTKTPTASSKSTYDYSDALTSADRMILVRMAAGEIAAREE